MFEEYQTAAPVAERLARLGPQVRTGLGETGVVADVHADAGAERSQTHIMPERSGSPLLMRNELNNHRRDGSEIGAGNRARRGRLGRARSTSKITGGATGRLRTVHRHDWNRLPRA